MTFRPLTEPVDYVVIAGQRTPGIAEISGADVPFKYDKRKGYGLSGAYSVFRGRELAEPTLTIRLYTDEDWDDWADFLPTVRTPPNARRPRALEIQHPILEDQGITAVTVTKLGQPMQTADGEWTITISLLEYRRPRLALAAPDGSEDGAGASAIDQLNAQNAALAAQRDRLIAQSLAGGGT